MFEIFKKKNKSKKNNVVNQLHIYRDNYGIWWFNDEDLGILHEVFVGDINLMIDIYAEGETELLVNISEYDMSDKTNVLIQSTIKQDIYQLSNTEIEGWLCPCLLQYFKEYPSYLYFQIIKIKR